MDKRYNEVISQIQKNLTKEYNNRVECCESLNKYIHEEINRAEAAEGDLNFDDDIRDDNGEKARDITTAVNAVNRKYNSILKVLVSLKAEVEAIRQNLG